MSLIAAAETTSSATMRQQILANIAESQAARASSGFLQFDRQVVARQFYAEAGFSPNQIAGHLQGINFTQPVRSVIIPYGATAQQFVGRGGVGNYFAPYGTTALQSGVQATGRSLNLFQSMGNIRALESTASPYVWPTGTVPGAGGGIQYFVPNKNSFVPIAR
jgi:filamentous hemagglutinin